MGQLYTANSYLLTECVSALQKTIRRGLHEEALFWATEIETKYANYLWVRLTVIANEDIGIADPQSLLLFETLRQQWAFLHAHSASPSERLVLANAILTLCRARKTRLADDLQCVVYRRRIFEDWRLDIPDYALDKHTGKGKRLGRGVEHWRAEGCKLANEEPGMNPYEPEATRLREQYGALPKKQRPSPAKRTAQSGNGSSSLDLDTDVLVLTDS